MSYDIAEVLDMRDCLIETIKVQTDKNNYGAGVMADKLMRSYLINEEELYRQAETRRRELDNT